MADGVTACGPATCVAGQLPYAVFVLLANTPIPRTAHGVCRLLYGL